MKIRIVAACCVALSGCASLQSPESRQAKINQQADEMSKAISSRCVSCVELLSLSTPPEALYLAISMNFGFSPDLPAVTGDQENIKKWKDMIAALIISAHSSCEENQTHRVCSWEDRLNHFLSDENWQEKDIVAKAAAETKNTEDERQKVNQMLDEQQKRIDAEEIERTGPNGITRDACAAQSTIRDAHRLISQLKAGGRESGYVNATELAQWGHVAAISRDSLKESRAKYRKLTGKTLDLSKCKEIEQPE